MMNVTRSILTLILMLASTGVKAVSMPSDTTHANPVIPAVIEEPTSTNDSVSPKTAIIGTDNDSVPEKPFGPRAIRSPYNDSGIKIATHSQRESGQEPEETRDWWQLLKKRKLNLADTTVEYPRFLGFCVKVYNWADRVFNSYDTTYVVGTGRRWKARLTSDNWVDSYYLNPNKKMPMRMMSDIYCNASAYLQYMAVSVGYSLDMSNIIGNKPSNHNKFEFNFNCARFNIELHFWENTGGTYMRTFGKYKDGHLTKVEFPGVSQRTLGASGYFIFNNRKFSLGAAYNFSKIQRKSAGSAIIGVNYENLDIRMDMHELPEVLKPYLTISPQLYKFHYNTYTLMSGYSYNWVLNKHLLFNISAFPGIGFTHTYADSYEADAHLFALTIKGMTSLTYNLGDFFACAILKMDGNWYQSGNFSFFSSIENAQFSLGVRF